MQVTINLTDRQKKGIRYMGVDNADLVAEFENSCSTIADRIVREAKKKFLATQTMDDIDPTPI